MNLYACAFSLPGAHVQHVCSAMHKSGHKQACRGERSESPSARGQMYLGCYPGTPMSLASSLFCLALRIRLHVT